MLPRAEATGNLRLITSARVTRVQVDRRGRATGVAFVKNGREHVQRAAVVMLAAHTYENVRLWLLSRSAAHPAGLANTRIQVGLGFMPHINPEVFGLFPGLDLKIPTGSWAQGVCIDDWNGDNFDHSGLGFISGGMFVGTRVAEADRPQSNRFRTEPRWGAERKRWIAGNARSVAVTLAQLDVLTYEGNHLDLDPVATDQHGTPLIRVTFRVRPREVEARAFLTENLAVWLREPARPTRGRHAAYGGPHMGNVPNTSVVDGFGFAHDVPNLGVLGCCTFPAAGGHNPTLTLQALAWRTAERVAFDWEAVAR